MVHSKAIQPGSLILGIETSCDDTSVCVLKGPSEVLSLVSANQDLSHSKFGGVVPEIASRCHLESLGPLIEVALEKAKVELSDLSGLAVTSRPGLVGSLIVGLVTAKTLSLSLNLPFVGVNHIVGHLLSPLLESPKRDFDQGFGFPFLGFAVSGGHTHLYAVSSPQEIRLLGRTVDDAAGEAFDKFGKMLRLPFPGGVQVDLAAEKGDPEKYIFPRPMMEKNQIQMSFSGLKTAAKNMIEKLEKENPNFWDQKEVINDLSASFRSAVVDVLIEKLLRGSRLTGIKNLSISGGVSANRLLRRRLLELRQKGHLVALPEMKHCTDNAAMIAQAGYFQLLQGEVSSQDLAPSPYSLESDFS